MPQSNFSGDGMSNEKNPATGPPRRDGGTTGAENRYVAPCLVRVRVRAARMVLGSEFADTFCTVHIHDNVGDACAF